jgi:hypothetical protein
MMPVAGNVAEVLPPRPLVLPFDLDVAEVGLALVVDVEIMNAHLVSSGQNFSTHGRTSISQLQALRCCCRTAQ